MRHGAGTLTKTGAALALALISAPPALAQDGASAEQAPEPAASNLIVVTAQRSGAPTWTVETEAGTVILVGEIRAVPKSTPWEPELLEEAAREADAVILRSRPKVSPGDIFRLIFRGGRFTKLPDKSVAADHLGPAQLERLGRLEARFDQDYARSSFLMTAFDLLARRLDFDDETTKDATDVVARAARRADVPVERPPRFRGKDLLDDLASADPKSHVPCLEAAMDATEAGPSIIEARGRDWRAFDVPAVMDNPLEMALGQCWPWADAEIGVQIRDAWTAMIADASARPGTTLAVVPLRVLAEEDGVLDRLEAQGLPIAGPDWRPAP